MSTETRRMWTAHEFLPLGEDRAEDDSRKMATHHLRVAIRRDGCVLDETSIVRGEPRAVTIANGEWATWDGVGQPDGHITEWTAGATARGVDLDEFVLDPAASDGEGIVCFEVPEAHQEFGGGLRLRHGLHGPVTVAAFRANGDQMGYLFAADIDDDQAQIELLPGAARLVVTRDPDPDEEEEEPVA